MKTERTRIAFESFADGRVTVKKPGGKTYATLNFGEERVGVTRYYNALNADVHISRVIHIPQHRQIKANFLAEIDGEEFVVKEAQHKNATFPKVTVLVLAEAGT